jgi:uncharacterized membrane-anchored protein
MTIPKPFLWPAFILVALAQLAIPARMIAQHEATISQGVEYRFRTAPVDPYDPFRGRFVALGYQRDETEVPLSPALAALDWGQREYQDPLYLHLEPGPDGFARLTLLDLVPPATGDYLRLSRDDVGYSGLSASGGLTDTANITLPFDRYYMNQAAAPEAERIYRERVSDADSETWVTVRLRDGHAVPTGLFIDGKPIEDLIRP